MFVEGDTGSSYEISLIDNNDNTPVDLTTATATLHWRNKTGVYESRVMTTVSAAGGKVVYTFATGELFAPTMVFEVTIADIAGHTVTSIDPITETVRSRL